MTRSFAPERGGPVRGEGPTDEVVNGLRGPVTRKKLFVDGSPSW